MAVGIVTDSAAALPRDTAARAGIFVVPMRLTIGGDTYDDDQVSLEEVLARSGEGALTSGPSPAAFAEAIEKADSGEGVVVLTVSEKMSSTYKSAQLGADLAGRQVRVLDTRTAAGAEGLVVLAAASAASSGAGLDAVTKRVEAVAGRARLVAAIDDIEHLARGGRIPEIAGKAGRYLGVRPLFEMRLGRIRPLRPALSREGALDAVVAHWRRSLVPGAALHLAVMHALAPDSAQRLLAGVSAELEPATCIVGTFGSVMVAHTGPGVAGLAWWWEERGANPAPTV